MTAIRGGGETGSVTLLGIWLLGMFMCISTLLFILSNDESQIILLRQENLPLQLAAESLVEKQFVKFSEDLERTKELVYNYGNYNGGKAVPTLVDSGETDKYTYSVFYKVQSESNMENRLLIAAVVEGKNEHKRANVFALQWMARIDEDLNELVLEGIG